MPKSITHYYQESGRAGRDGEKADCILFYSYKDKQVLEGMIKKSSTDPYSQSTRRKIDQLYTCLRYCEDDFRCRRTMQLEFFGESFHKSKCRGTCDNCKAGREIEKRDLTEMAKSVLNLLSAIQAQRKNGMGVTLLQLTELFRGSKAKAATKFLNLSRLQGYGDATRFQLKKKQDIDRIAHALIFERILTETSEVSKQGFSTDYVQPGENAAAIRSNRRRFFVDFPKAGASGKENDAPTTPAAGNKRKKSTARKKANSSSTAKKASGRASTGTAASNVIAIDDDSNDEDGLHDDDNDDESTKQDLFAIKNGLLDPRVTNKLAKRIQNVAQMWATEESYCGGKKIYCKLFTRTGISELTPCLPDSQ